MSPEPLPGPAFRASGGDIVSRCGGSLAAPIRFFRYLAIEAQQRQAGDPAAAQHCARTALELAEAIVAADEWRRAGGAHNSPLRGENLLTNEVNALRQS